MPKLYFRYGTMNSSKTMNLLSVAHNYEAQNKKVMVIKPSIDNRFGISLVKSRAGLERKADIVVDQNTNLLDVVWDDIECLLVDEVQFFFPAHIEQMRRITLQCPVICYGLRTDYRTELFPASKRLMELADSIEEVKTTCMYCSKKSIINMKCIDGKVVTTGSGEPDVGGEEKYIVVCWACWTKNEK